MQKYIYIYIGGYSCKTTARRGRHVLLGFHHLRYRDVPLWLHEQARATPWWSIGFVSYVE